MGDHLGPVHLVFFSLLWLAEILGKLLRFFQLHWNLEKPRIRNIIKISMLISFRTDMKEKKMRIWCFVSIFHILAFFMCFKIKNNISTKDIQYGHKRYFRTENVYCSTIISFRRVLLTSSSLRFILVLRIEINKETIISYIFYQNIYFWERPVVSWSLWNTNEYKLPTYYSLSAWYPFCKLMIG